MFKQFCVDQLPTLIGLTGSRHFLSSLMGATTRSVGLVDVCSLSYYDDAIRPVGFATASCSMEEMSRRSAERYVSDFGLHDPLCQSLQAFNPSRDPTIFHLAAEDILHSAYREMNYTRTKTVERTSIVFRQDRAWFTINFYTKEKSGRFAPSERAALAELAPVISSLVLKHVSLTGLSTICAPESPQQRIMRRLTDRTKNLSEREREICSLIVLGHTSAAIGLILDLSPNTVLTYRKRAYTKLNIGSQNELFRICLD